MSKSAFRSKKKIKILLIILSVFALIYIHFSVNVNPILERTSKEEIKAMTSLAVNTAAEEVMSENVAYGQLVNIKMDGQEVGVIETNTHLINNIARQTMDRAQKNINDMGDKGVKVPIGSLSGITFLSGLGPKLSIKVKPVGTIKMTYSSRFENAGINQTNHKILLNVTCEVSIIMPGVNDVVQVNTEVLLCESVIIGKVPQVYLNSMQTPQKINLIP